MNIKPYFFSLKAKRMKIKLSPAAILFDALRDNIWSAD